jgi:hypothetical protein
MRLYYFSKYKYKDKTALKSRMQINYKNGKIYEIVCRITGEKYVGSTTQPLSKRLAEHRNLKKNNTISKQIIERGDYYINLLEECPCDNREQLLQRERHFYDSIEGGCINKRRPYISEEEDKTRREAYKKENKEHFSAYRKAYYEENKEQFIAKWKAYYEENKEKKLAKNKAYYEENKERALSYRKSYNEKNREKINAYMRAYRKR